MSLRRRFGNPDISVPVEADEHGHIDRRCPAHDCGFRFKVHAEDWKEVVRDEEVFCPNCGRTATSDRWLTPEQSRQLRREAEKQAKFIIEKALNGSARDFNRRQPRNSMIKLSVTAPRAGVPPIVVPIRAAEAMTLRLACRQCDCRFAFVGAAYFCPSCGHNSVEDCFEQSIERIRSAIRTSSEIRVALDRDTAEQVLLSLRENAINNLVTAFQSLADRLYEARTSKEPPKNAFQSLNRGSQLLETECGVTFEAIIGTQRLARLGLFFQRRHILSHNGGIVDDEYLVRSGDSAYRSGQRLVVQGEEVLEMAQLVEDLGRGVRAALTPAATSEDSATE
ncbi:MAG: hypothetical protein AAF851_09235 [Myxococcota bacterium]